MEAASARQSVFAIKTDVFEGPLELLLELVEKRKLLINDISLASVTDEYMQHVAKMQEASLPNTAQFVALAATLLLIKSKSLLPVFELTEEEEQSIEDLEERLKLLQIYKKAGKVIGDTFGTNMLHGRQFVPSAKPIFTTDSYTTKKALEEAMRRVITNLPKKIEQPKVRVRKVVSLEDMIKRLHERIESQAKVLFSDLLKDEQEKTTVVVGFLAVLESVKQGVVLVSQIDRYGDIEIEREKTNTPRYY